jgi:hypothetical protein
VAPTKHAVIGLLSLGAIALCGSCGESSGTAENAGAGGNAGVGGSVPTGGNAGVGGSVPVDGSTNQAVIPEGRIIDWSHAGVPGGIPLRTDICATIDASLYGNGTANAAPAINAAIDGCAENKVVSLPAGTYFLGEPIDLKTKRQITLRGAGMGKTLLKPADGIAAAILTGQANQSSERTILGGSDKGSTSITVSDATGITPGTMLDIYESNDPDFYWSRGGAVDHIGQFVMVTGVTGTTVEIEDPLVWGFHLNPRFKVQTNRGIEFVGVEDLTITGGNGYGGSMIQFWNAYASWVKNVETAWGNGNEHIFLYGSLRCEIRDSYIHDTYSTTDGYGIETAMGYGGPRGGCTGTLIENNVFSGLWGATVLETEVGSVIAYNFSRNMRFVGWPDYQINDFNGNHGPHGMMCLYEGNVGGGGVLQDGYHGSVSHATYFRNAFSGVHVEPNRTGNIKLVDLCRFSYYHNVVGNVLGSPAWPRTTTGKYEMTGQPGYTEQAVIYRLGYPNMGNNSYNSVNPPSNADQGGLDPKVASTLMRWGNFDYQNNATRWENSEIPQGVPPPSTQTLPPSLRYSSKPAWWPQNMVWPPIGPDKTPMVDKIPAEVRYEAL